MLTGPAVARRRVQGIFFGWWIVAAASVLSALNQGLLGHGFTMYFLPLQAEFGWSRALLSSGFALSHVESGILGPIAGWLADLRGDYRQAFTILALFAGFGSLFFAFASKPTRRARPPAEEVSVH
ncbi:MAG: hypothetical protein EXR53_00610 [Dehalococcoidia bacterium]|nr:hypothetical protein [Dehalococcoidia bacterium]